MPLPARYFSGLAGSFSVFVVVYYFSIIEKTMRINWVSTALAKTGTKSLQIYCISISLLSFYLPRLYSVFCEFHKSSLFSNYGFVYDFMFALPIAIIYCIVLYFITIGIEKIRIGKFVFGR